MCVVKRSYLGEGDLASTVAVLLVIVAILYLVNVESRRSKDDTAISLLVAYVPGGGGVPIPRRLSVQALDRGLHRCIIEPLRVDGYAYNDVKAANALASPPGSR